MSQRAYCSICSAPLDFTTDGKGRHIEIHPKKPCVAPPPPEREVQWRRCQNPECGREFVLEEGRGKWAAKSCSGECARAVEREQDRRRRAAGAAHGERLRDYWLKRGRMSA